MTEEEKDLEDTLREELDQLVLDTKEIEVSSNKRLHLTLENHVSVELFATKDFGFKIVLTQDKEKEELDMESVDKESTWDPVRFPVLE